MQKIFSTVLLSLFVISNLISQDVNIINGSGQKTGKWIKKYENGKTKYEGQFKKGIPTGTFTYYFNTGKNVLKMFFPIRVKSPTIPLFIKVEIKWQKVVT